MGGLGYLSLKLALKLKQQTVALLTPLSAVVAKSSPLPGWLNVHIKTARCHRRHCLRGALALAYMMDVSRLHALCTVLPGMTLLIVT